jgi:drug/metabolite transporter (DMT)-like permease
MFKRGIPGEVFIISAAAIAGLLPVFAKGAYALGMQPMDVVTWRFIIAAPAMWLVAWLVERGPRSAPKSADTSPIKPMPQTLPRVKLLLLGVLFTLAAGLGFIGFAIMPASTYLVLFYSYPAMVALLGLFFGERLAGRGWLALGLTIIGIMLTAPNFSEGLSGENVPGALVAICTAVVVAVHYVISSRILRGYGQRAQASAWMISGTLIAFGVISIVRGGLAMPPSLLAWAYLFGVGAMCTAFGFYWLYTGLQRVSTSKAAVLGTTEAAFSLTLAALLLHERMQPIQVLGAVLIVLSIVLLQAPIPERFQLRKARTSVSAPESAV